MNEQERLNVLRQAGEMLAPIFLSEAVGGEVPFATFGNGSFSVIGTVGKYPNSRTFSGSAETLDAAFVQFLANRSDELRKMEQEQAEREAFEQWKASQQPEQVAA